MVNFFYYVYLFSDINECDFENGNCSDICNNTDGSYFCSCLAGFQLDDSGLNCLGKYNVIIIGDKEREGGREIKDGSREGEKD